MLWSICNSADQTHGQLNPDYKLDSEKSEQSVNSRCKCSSADRHSPQQRRSNTLPESHRALLLPRLRKRLPHGAVDLLVAKAVSLHLTLDNVKRIAAQPQSFASQTSVRSHFPRRDLLPVNLVALGVVLHQVFKGKEPHAVRLRLTEPGHGRATVQAGEHTIVGGELADAVNGAGVELASAVRLCLQPDTDVFDRRGEGRVCDTSKCTGGVELAVGKWR